MHRIHFYIRGQTPQKRYAHVDTSGQGNSGRRVFVAAVVARAERDARWRKLWDIEHRAARTISMADKTPRDKATHTLTALLNDLDRTGFKLTGALKALVLSGGEKGRLCSQGLGDPVCDATCLVCDTAYEVRLGGMLLACTACAPLVAGVFPSIGDWARMVFADVCHAIVEAGHMELPAEDDMHSCRFCGRGTNLWIGTQFAAPHFCQACTDTLQEWNARGYLRLLEERDRR